MAYLINREKMHFLAKHMDTNVLSCLAWIEHPDIATAIVNIDKPSDWGFFTMYELNLLYIHTTGQKLGVYAVDAIYKIINSLAENVLSTKVNSFEVIMQANCIKRED